MFSFLLLCLALFCFLLSTDDHVSNEEGMFYLLIAALNVFAAFALV